MAAPIPGVDYRRSPAQPNWRAYGRPDLAVATRDPRYHPFASDAIWNIGIGSGATFEANTPGTPTYQLLNAGYAKTINSATYSVSVGVAKSTDPWRTVTSETSSNTWLIQIPDNLTATGGSDGWVSVISADGRLCYEFYAAKRLTSGNWTTRYDLIVTDLLGHGLNGRRASLTSQMAGLIRKGELAARFIPHALGLAIPMASLKLTPVGGGTDGDNIGFNSSGGGFVWPARGADNQANIPYSGPSPMGSVWAIPGAVDIRTLGLSADGLAVADALQNNGAVVIAQANNITIQAEPTANQAQVAAIKTDMPAIVAQLRRMTNSRGGSINASTRIPDDSSVILGGGTSRRRQLLPQPTP